MGGYAVLSALTKHPQYFVAGVDMVGISNLETILEGLPKTWLPEIEKYYRLIGDPRTEEGVRFLRANSPVHYAENIVAPLLMGQGENDPRVPKRESEQMVEVLESLHRDLIYALFPDEGHGFLKENNRVAFNLVVEQFLARYLGGRAQSLKESPD